MEKVKDAGQHPASSEFFDKPSSSHRLSQKSSIKAPLIASASGAPVNAESAVACRAITPPPQRWLAMRPWSVVFSSITPPFCCKKTTVRPWSERHQAPADKPMDEKKRTSRCAPNPAARFRLFGVRFAKHQQHSVKRVCPQCISGIDTVLIYNSPPLMLHVLA